jgi:DUF2075 family protein
VGNIWATQLFILSLHHNMANRCLYSASFGEFMNSKPLTILGALHNNYHGDTPTTTDEAWMGEITIMQQVLIPWKEEHGQIIFEYDIPRLGKRIDVVLLLRGLIFCLEFKVGKQDDFQADIEQVMDYALDLKNFHLFSHNRTIVPILIPTKFKTFTTEFRPSVYHDDIYNPMISGEEHLQELIMKVLEHSKAYIDEKPIENWLISPYAPTPTIIEAARTLYENHSVEEITRHEADKVSTDTTINYILQVIQQSKEKNSKSICFVTGVPGAGKTLVGLDVAIKQTYKDGEFDKENGAVYLSGNGPLVAVLTEALARDNQCKCSQRGEKKNLSDSRREVSEFIQIIHRYRDNMLAKIKNPVENGELEIDPEKAVKLQKTGYGEVEHVAIFDEAQRSWTHKRIADYLKRGGTYGNKLKVPNFPMSEAEFLIWSLDQREDWAVIICLVGGGQEINTGEAGITEWIKALNNRFKHWNVYISNKLTDPEYAEGRVNELLKENKKVSFSDSLHLAVSLRSFRAETLSAFIHSLLSFAPDAQSLYQDVRNKKYPIILTRDMEKARQWLRKKARGTQQTGVLVTKVAARFKPLAVNILAQGDENAVHWFLEDKTDIRSSNYLEDAATEIQVQGLELDFACVLWDADMRCENGQWTYYKFNGKNKWIPERNVESQKYMLNAYRVLLTRARQGIIICVPFGNSNKTPEGFNEDPTRLPAFYDGTYKYLKSLGIEEI